MSLLADAGRNLSDLLALVVAWTVSRLVKRTPSPRYTYGLAGSSILAALFSAVFLFPATGVIIGEAISRLLSPFPVAGGTVMVVAAVCIAINGITAWLFASGYRGDLNIRMEGTRPDNASLIETARELSYYHFIGLATLQVEDRRGPPCSLTGMCRP